MVLSFPEELRGFELNLTPIGTSDRFKFLAIIRKGYVGLPLAIAAVDTGWSVIGI